MNIYTFKTQFEGVMHSQAPAINAEAAWNYFKDTLYENFDGESCEEFGFSARIIPHLGNPEVNRNDQVFEIYFGRLIDAVKGHSWRTADINVYFRFEIAPDLQLLLQEFQNYDMEDVYCCVDHEEDIRQKLDRFITDVDIKQNIWAAIRGRAPFVQDMQFLIY